MTLVAFKRRGRQAGRRIRQIRMLVAACTHPYRPIVAHLIPTRRCNLACTYCNEFDDHSAPVPADVVCRRIDRLAALGTSLITLSGGEPLLHPDLDRLVRHIRDRVPIATVITNGYLLTPDRIRRLNRAGLDHLQISIDNVTPDEVSNKSLKVLDQKLRMLQAHAEFDVTVNSVIGAGLRHPDDAWTIARRARALGFSTTVGIIHAGGGHLIPLDDAHRSVLERTASLEDSVFDYATYNRFQRNLAAGRANAWQCRAGSRYLYVCEDGLVHWCSQQRGTPGIPLDDYGPDDLEREYHADKSCAPFCTVGCVHRVAQIDDLRRDPRGTVSEWFAARGAGRQAVPAPVRVLMWAFVTGPGRQRFRRAAARLFDAGQRS